jgi:putative ABC transport system permease protein
MRLGEALAQALSNLRDMKLRTALTALGVAVGIGALVAMVGFGQGVQRNVSESFEKLDLFSSLTVLPRGLLSGRLPSGPAERPADGGPAPSEGPVLDDEAVKALARIPGVESAFPEVRFPAVVSFRGNEEFRFVQLIPASLSASKSLRLEAGRPFARDDEGSLIVSRSLLRALGVRPGESVLGRTIGLSSMALDFSLLSPGGLASVLGGQRLPLKRQTFEFILVGIAESAARGPVATGSEVYLPSGWASRMPRLPFTSIWDLFRARDGRLGYSAVNIRLASPADVEPVKRRVRDMGFSTFALVDQFTEVRHSFVYLNMVLAAIGMIAIFVAALGIMNTMVMSILERYAEIGLMKAIGASRRDVKRVFFFESGAIGLLGGLGGLALGLAVSGVINRIVNGILARQGIPPIAYFRFPLWLCLGAMAFAVGVSLVSGIYPALRASRVDPVVALRHE